MRMLFLVLVARSGAGVAGSELLQRREWPRGVVLGLARERGHGAALAAAREAALSSAAPQHQLQAVQRNASGLSGAVRRLAGLCDGADPWARDAQSARVPEAPQEGQQKSCRAYQNLSSSGAAVDEVLFFPAGTLAFGHAAGWANATESEG
ncbi:hypothetical protein EMIHUDRAFT_240761 [Emiliania huxleyi CCMP1516]|uniref:Uncharacterized protein n=2 Tax=Emiliania huxleyi TaxID=2903 RepID=A0A0D3JEI5_EMIH1|nr:hypothetical protein EMIHUDRAFT_240761 [Emiliania huxleyi CCMP1516]EOD21920.1 hypothetical protein EMIHUDRAFT_240761 [Emiliania huxleyi CCMP1516]|eukprot:XP_005774349.1 hypothetical protein EMIHUDRAFT_240761 [Emiliania huxleyi CCMP1516]